MIKIGIVGCGAVTHTNYARTLAGRRDYGVRYVHDLDSERAASAARLYGCVAVSFERLEAESDAIVICTPPASHAELVTRCLRPGRVVLCEKPFMTSHDDAATVVESARTIGAQLYVAHFRRAYPQVELARDLVALGAIGEVASIEASEGGRFVWRAASNYTMSDRFGGVLWDTGSHTLDTCMFVAGLDGHADPQVVIHQSSRDAAEPSHELAATFRLAAGAREVDGSLRLSRRDALPNVITVTGTRGHLSFVTGLDDRVRLTTTTGTRVVSAGRSHDDLLECLDRELRLIFQNSDGASDFAAARFVGQVKLLEALADA